MKYSHLHATAFTVFFVCFSIGVQIFAYTDDKAFHNFYWVMFGLITLALVAYYCVSVPQIIKHEKENQRTKTDLKNAIAFLEREDPVLLTTFCDRHQLLRSGQCFDLFVDDLSPENAKIVMGAFHKLVKKVVLSKNAKTKAISEQESQIKA